MPSTSRPGCPGITACRLRRSACGHADRVDTYRDARQAWEAHLDRAVPGAYAQEIADWTREHPAPTFRDFLIQTRRPS